MRSVAFALLFPGLLFAQKIYTDARNQFRVQPPFGWTTAKNPEHFKVLFIHPKKSARFGVTVEELRTIVPASEFVSEIGLQLDGLELPDEAREPGPADLKRANAESGAIRAFLQGEGTSQLRQDIAVFSRKTRVYTLIITYPAAEEKKYAPVVRNLIQSFRILGP